MLSHGHCCSPAKTSTRLRARPRDLPLPPAKPVSNNCDHNHHELATTTLRLDRTHRARSTTGLTEQATHRLAYRVRGGERLLAGDMRW